MSEGKCACCGREMNLVAKRLCGRCYPYNSRGEIFWDGSIGQWLARTEVLAEKLGCYWQDDPERFEDGGRPVDDLGDLAGECEPMGDGEFAQAAQPEESEAESAEPVEQKGFDAGDPLCPEAFKRAQASEEGEAVEDVLVGFESYAKLARPTNDPCVTVQRNGKVLFTRSALRVFDFSGMSHVRLHYNRDTNQMAMQLLVGDFDGKALKLSNVKKGVDICFHAAGFFKAMGVKPKRNRPFILDQLRPGVLVATVDIERAA